MAMYFSEQGFYSVMEITKFDRGEGVVTPKSRMKPYFDIPNFEGWTRYNHRNIFFNHPYQNFELIKKKMLLLECYF